MDPTTQSVGPQKSPIRWQLQSNSLVAEFLCKLLWLIFCVMTVEKWSVSMCGWMLTWASQLGLFICEWSTSHSSFYWYFDWKLEWLVIDLFQLSVKVSVIFHWLRFLPWISCICCDNWNDFVSFCKWFFILFYRKDAKHLLWSSVLKQRHQNLNLLWVSDDFHQMCFGITLDKKWLTDKIEASWKCSCSFIE